ncbi:hypothetical protein, partial [Paenibacillus sp. J22TS3]|uniref:hypothetical protein n=1 Tax=Paenibacillus sp. J22TS3 TaxID=2807192 RepID=UPI001BCC1E4E
MELTSTNRSRAYPNKYPEHDGDAQVRFVSSFQVIKPEEKMWGLYQGLIFSRSDEFSKVGYFPGV